jgi:hypothetical protein
MYHCTECDLTFKTKKNIQAHYKTKKHLNKNKDNRYKCPCGKSYSYRQGLYSHKQKCTYIGQQRQTSTSSSSEVQLLRTENEELRRRHELFENERKKEIEEMKAQISLLLDKQAGTTTNTNSNNTNIENQNNTINININAFGSENTDYLDDQAILQCIDRVYKSIPALLQKIHFDPQHPENHNIKITNKKLPYASVMGNNQRWKTMDRKDAIDKMVNNGYYMLDEKYETNKEKFDPRKQKNFEGFKDKFETEEKNTMKMVKGDVEMMVLNGGT